MYVHGLDVKNAFLNGKLEHELYMAQPEGFIDQEHPHYVCRLNKTVYGLKQSPREWYNTIKPVLVSVGVVPSHTDNGLFSGIVDGDIVLLAIYVDDIFIASCCLKVINEIKFKLSEEFAMKDMGEVKNYLGIDMITNAKMERFHFHKLTLLVPSLPSLTWINVNQQILPWKQN